MGILRRGLLDQAIVCNEEHRKQPLEEFIEEYYYVPRPHNGLEGETPSPID
jgi:hypothetical protein